MGKGEGLRSADGRSGDATRSTRDGVDNIAIARRAPALSGGAPGQYSTVQPPGGAPAADAK